MNAVVRTVMRVHLGRVAGMLVALAAALLILAIFAPRYYDASNVRVLGLQMAAIGIASVGTTFLLISGNIDLSIGSVFGLAAVAAVMLAQVIPSPAALAVGLLIAAALGFVNGKLVWRISVSPIIITLASLTIIRGVSFLITKGSGQGDVDESFTAIGRSQLLGVSTLIWALIAVVVIGHVLLSWTTFGRHVYAIGGNRVAAAAAGISVRRITLLLFLGNGALVGLAAILTASRFGSASPTFGTGFELDVITAVLLGGVAFTGGVGSIIGVILAVILLTVIKSGMVSLGIDAYWTSVVQGGALLLAVILDQVTHEQHERLKRLLAMSGDPPARGLATSGGARLVQAARGPDSEGS